MPSLIFNWELASHCLNYQLHLPYSVEPLLLMDTGAIMTTAQCRVLGSCLLLKQGVRISNSLLEVGEDNSKLKPKKIRKIQIH